MGSGHPLPIWKFRHLEPFLSLWSGRGRGGKHVLFLASIILLFFSLSPEKGDRVGKPYPLFHDAKRARFAQRTSPSVRYRKEASMAGVWRGPGREERKGYATFETQIQKIKFYIWKKLDWLRSWPYFECSMKMKTA